LLARSLARTHARIQAYVLSKPFTKFFESHRK